jgi:superfamily I DNA/RNA helicase
LKAHNNNVNFLQTGEEHTSNLEKKMFQTIIIDEIQDYHKDWIRNLKMFLAPEGEFVVFGDEKQNIYQRDLDEKKPYTSIPGQWNILKLLFV